MAELSEQAKLRLVTHLAQFSGPAEAARLVSIEFGVTLTRAQAWKYDPSRSGCQVGPKLRHLFFEVRDRWLNQVSNIAVANKGHRLRTLDRLVAKLEERGDYLGALRALEQAAREMGGSFESRAGHAVATESGQSGQSQGVASMREELQLRLQSLVEVVGIGPSGDLNQRSSPAP